MASLVRFLAPALATLAVAGAVSSSSAFATTFVEEKFVCPVGGEKFKANVVASNSSSGQRPDGRPFSPLPVYPIVECPGNGLLLIEEKFTPDALAMVASAVSDPEYQAMRASESQHYRAWWLRKRLQYDVYDQASSLLQASWESDDNFERKVRYQIAFVAAATALKRRPDKADVWHVFQFRAANALRELGHFGKAAELLNRIDQPDFLPTDSQKRKYAEEAIAQLRLLIAEQNPASEPANMIPDSQAAWRCELANPPLTAVETAVCEKESLQDMRRDARKAVERMRSKKRI